MSEDLVKALDAKHWIFSSDGTRFRHPDARAVSRILRWCVRADPILGFNVPSTFNGWWNNPDWQDRFGYTVEYGEPADGLTLRFAPV